jgi:hypothetical protein
MGSKGPQALLKQSPETMWTHCMIHYESLARKELCLELSVMMDTVIRYVSFMKTHPLRGRLAELCKEISFTPVLL